MPAAPTIEKDGLHYVVGFHARDGWFVRREEGGGVHLYLVPPPHVGHRAPEVAAEVHLDRVTWASVVATVSAAGETADTFARARRLHMYGEGGGGA